MIRMRFVAMIGVFVMLLGGWATYDAFFRATPEFVGATDAAHVTAVKALVAGLPAPAGATLDPYGTWCGGASAGCWTSTTQQPKPLISALTKTLVASGAKVRSHECEKPEAAPSPAPDGSCIATVDYHGSRIDVAASSLGKADNGGRDYLRIDSALVTPSGNYNSNTAPALPSWASVNPFPAAWTTGMTCTKAVHSEGCRSYGQQSAASPLIALPRAQVCAAVVADLRGRYFIDMDEDLQHTGESFCRVVAHRFRSLVDKDGESVFVVATSVSVTSTRLSFDIHSGS
jgi:hypothetical protein